MLQSAPDHDGALRLLVDVKIRQNLFLGIWWRINAWLTRTTTRAIAVLTGAYLVQRALGIWAASGGRTMTAEIISVAWLAICVYSWIAPALHARALKKELEEIRLKTDF